MKIADDLYIGGDTANQLLHNWTRVLKCFRNNNLRLSAPKTVVCPVATTILGWEWSSGTIAPSPHKINPIATCPPPTTVKALRSWTGSYKYLKSCIPGYSTILAPMEAMTAGKDSATLLTWDEANLDHFHKAQAAVTDPRTVTIPRPSDKLIITSS